jgi:TPR repeat protein
LEEAERWYETAAAKGDVVGLLYLGSLLLERKEIPRGVELISRAASEGYAPALYRIGQLRAIGIGVQKDEDEAFRSMNWAAAQGHPFAQRWVAARRLRGREGVEGFFRGLSWFLRSPYLAWKLKRKEPDDENMLVG